MEIKAIWEPTVPKPYGYVYVTHDLAENKYYCGKHKSEKFDVNYFGSGVLLKKSMSIHEPANFVSVPIDWAASAEELHEKEVSWIQYYNAVNDLQWYNLIEDSDDYYKEHKEVSRDSDHIKIFLDYIFVLYGMPASCSTVLYHLLKHSTYADDFDNGPMIVYVNLPFKKTLSNAQI